MRLSWTNVGHFSLIDTRAFLFDVFVDFHLLWHHYSFISCLRNMTVYMFKIKWHLFKTCMIFLPNPTLITGKIYQLLQITLRRTFTQNVKFKKTWWYWKPTYYVFKEFNCRIIIKINALKLTFIVLNNLYCWLKYHLRAFIKFSTYTVN